MSEHVEAVLSHKMGCMEVWGGNHPMHHCLQRPGLDMWGWSQRAGAVEAGGGELYYLSSCASGRITRMMLADVCAGGEVFGELADELRCLMMQNVNAVKQARIVQNLHERLDAFSDKGGFVSALVTTYFAPTKSFAVCNAGHPPPLLYRAKRKRWSIMKQRPGDAPIPAGESGVMRQQEYQQFRARLANDDLIFAYSNVLTECRDKFGRVLGVEGLLKRLDQLDAGRPGEMLDTLVSQIKEECPDELVASDATALLCRATTSKVGWRNNLLAPLRLLGRVANNTQLDA